MQKRSLGSLQVSLVGLGTNNFGRRMEDSAVSSVVHACLDSGINFFDTADVYGGTRSEELLGAAVAGRRQEAIIATKFGIPLDEQRKGGASPAYIRQAAEDSLRRLNTDYIDLYQLHRPDDSVPIADTLAALDALVKAGKVREIGCSNFSVAQLREAEAAVKAGAARFVSVQNEYSLFNRADEDDVLPECARLDIGYLPYFPLANGLLTGKYRKGLPAPEGTRLKNAKNELLSDENLNKVEALIQFAEARGHSILELAFSWLAAQPSIPSVIAGATSAEQVRANAAAVRWELNLADLAEIDAIMAPVIKE
ncbi:MAG: aldo/keto reductase [Chloroflexi bacterium]|nr:aldo/keto reductase [Chloroflexota bacterium]MCC6894613.1 aldo/keto reductase [Anaerolineae bacterium]